MTTMKEISSYSGAKKKLNGEMIDCKSLDYLLSFRLGQDFELSHFSFLNSSSICSLGCLAWSGNTVFL